MKAKAVVHVPREDPDVPPDFSGQRYCVCSRRWDSPVHDMPKVPAETVATEARRLGERERDLPANVVPIRGRTDGRRRAGGAG